MVEIGDILILNPDYWDEYFDGCNHAMVIDIADNSVKTSLNLDGEKYLCFIEELEDPDQNFVSEIVPFELASTRVGQILWN